MKNKIKLGGITLVMALLSATAVAQESDAANANNPERPELRRGEFGARYMPTFSAIELKNKYGDKIQTDVTTSHGFGIMLAGNISKNLGIQAEVSYLDISQKYKDQNLDRTLNVAYLNIPLLLSLNTDKTRMLNLNFVAGPQFGINVGSSISTSGDESSEALHATVGASGTDIGLAYGSGVEVALNKMHTWRLDFGYRGFYGLFDATVKQPSNRPDTYNVIVRTSRITQGGYIGMTLCF